MKRKETLILIELVVMIGVLSLASAICLRLFADANARSLAAMDLDHSVIEARSIAQVIRYTDGDLSSSAELFGGNAESDTWQIGYDDTWEQTTLDPTYLITVTKKTADIPTLGRGEITVTKKDAVLFTMDATWQVEDGYEK